MTNKLINQTNYLNHLSYLNLVLGKVFQISNSLNAKKISNKYLRKYYFNLQFEKNNSNLNNRFVSSCFNNLNFVLNKKENLKLTPCEAIHTQVYNRKLLNSKNNFFYKMSTPTINYFAHSFIDRASDKRKDKQWIDEQIRNENSVFVLFHIDKPFVTMNDTKNMYSLYKFNYSQIKNLLEKTELENPCKFVFLGVEYEPKQSKDETNFYEKTSSPYSHPDIYDHNLFKSWFAIDASSYNTNVEQITSMFAQYGTFFEGNFLRLV